MILGAGFVAACKPSEPNTWGLVRDRPVVSASYCGSRCFHSKKTESCGELAAMELKALQRENLRHSGEQKSGTKR